MHQFSSHMLQRPHSVSHLRCTHIRVARIQASLVLLCLHHDFGLFYKVILRHGALFNHLNGHVMLALPLSILHHSKLAAAQLLNESEMCGVNLPDTWSKQERQKEQLYLQHPALHLLTGRWDCND